MRWAGFRKLLGWSLLIVGLSGLGSLAVQSDVRAEALWAAAAKICLLITVAVSVSAFLWERSSRRLQARARLLEQFASTLPAAADDVTAEQLFSEAEERPELESFARALRLVSERVRHIVDRANLEVSRREAILSCMAEGVLAVDCNLNVVFCNETFSRTFSARTPITEGRMLFEVVREPVLRDVLGRVVNGGQPEAARIHLPSAGSRWFEARALPLASAAKSGAVIVLHDITDIQVQEQLRKDFVADVSHELRTPLAAIRGYAETLLDGALEDSANKRTFVEIILSHAIRLNNIASDLLVLSEIDAKTDDGMTPERIPVLDVISSASNSVQNAASLRDVKLDRSGCQECFVLGHRFRLEQVISNLLDNAVKFNRPQGTVRIECGRPNNGDVLISVEDTGVGIPQSDLKRIFERFYRVDRARSRATGGTGLGLPIVKEVVERMDGSVQVESQLGKGSKFTIQLKAAQ